MLFSPTALKGKSILITGASSGIGAKCAELFDELGAQLILTGRNEKRLNQVKENLSGSSMSIVADLSSEDGRAILENETGQLDGIVHCAGISPTTPFKYQKESDLQDNFDINVLAPFDLTKRLYKSKKLNNGSSIVFISSVMGLVGSAGRVSYSISKGALISGVKSLALELSPKGIRANTVSPGVVISSMSQDSPYMKDEESRKRVEGLHPLGFGSTMDVASVCAFLVSDMARWVTGANWVVDGGYTAH